MNVTFKYSLDSIVVTPFGDKGIVSMLGVDDGGLQYFVKTSNASSWFKEAQLIDG